MTREIAVYTWCDLCFAQEQRVEGEERAVTLPELGRPLVLSLCERHRKEVYEPLQRMLEEYGQPLPKPERQDRSRKRAEQQPTLELEGCPECDYRTASRAALSTHARRKHGKSLSELMGEPTPHACPECERGFARPQGLATHRRSAHGATPADPAGEE